MTAKIRKESSPIIVPKHILHVCNDFLGSKIYKELYKQLHTKGVIQTVFVPKRKNKLSEKNTEGLRFDYELVYSRPLKKWHRLIFEAKRKWLLKDIQENVSLNSINIIHATTLFSDGSIAYELYKKYSIPYIVTVRNTDISTFFKYRSDLLPYAVKVLQHSKQVIFITPALKNRFFNNKYIAKHSDKFKGKCIIIPNGVDSFWLANSQPKKAIALSKFIYVGSLIPRKNVPALSKAILDLRVEYPDISLTIVGDGGNDADEVKVLAARFPKVIAYLGRIHDKQELRNVLRAHHCFVMPSRGETFGLVYIEALSQGLPVVYSLNDGVDGLISEDAGYGIEAHSVESIKQGLRAIVEQYPSFNLTGFKLDAFDWSKIAKNYMEVYNRALD